MLSQKRLQILILLAVALALVAFSVIATLLVTHHLNNNQRNQSKAALGVVTNRPRYDLFAGHGLCEKAIYRDIQGKILKLHMDSRNALYDQFERTNTLLFSAYVVPEGQTFLSEQHSTVKMTAQCITSADTNQLLNLYIGPADE